MRRSLGWSLLAFVLAFANARADLVIPEPALDLGRVRAGQQFEHRVPIVNTGAAAVEITEVKAGCGCVRADVTPRVLAPGQKAGLVLRINTLSVASGLHAWRVSVHAKSGANELEAAMLVRAEVIQEVIVQPPAIIVYSDSATRHELSVTDLRTKPFRILKLEPSSPHLKAVVTEEGRSPQGAAVWKIQLDVGAGFAPGRYDETLIIHTDDALYPQLQVSLSVTKKPRQRYSALPPSVTLVASAAQPAPWRIVTLRDSRGQPVEIERVVADDPAITCEWSKTATTVATLKITVDRAKMIAESLNSRVQVYFKTDGEKLSIPVRCEAR